MHPDASVYLVHPRCPNDCAFANRRAMRRHEVAGMGDDC